MTDRPTVARLGPGDLQSYADLMTLFGEAFEDLPTYTGLRPDDGYARRLLSADHVIVLVARVDDMVVGGLVAYDLIKAEQARSEVYIYDLAVAGAHRRRGIATALIEALKPIAAGRGASVIFVQADPGDDPAIALYTRLGRREDVLHFDIPTV
jgi:ribosomal protein S18 acetylase RimI-like enzyme